MVSMLVLNAVDHWFKPQSGQTTDNSIKKLIVLTNSSAFLNQIDIVGIAESGVKHQKSKSIDIVGII